MNSNLAIKAGRKLFEKNLESYTPVDPLYETYTDSKGKQRRRKRELPPGLSTRDAKILKSVKRRAHYLDKGFSVCGMRFGWTFVIGIVPGAGDVADAILNYYLVVRKARQAELPAWLVRRMLINNIISISVGLVPIVGDVVLAAYKANSRNAALLEEYLRIRGEEYIKNEHERIENPDNVRPGAGREAGEQVPGAQVEKKGSSGSNWFRRKSNKSTKSQGKEKETISDAGVSNPATPVVPEQRGSRFYENVGEGDAKGLKAKAA